METAPRLKPGDRAPDLPLTDAHGRPVKLSALWAGGPILLTFLRHFGCIFCRQRLAELGQAQPALAAAGLTSVAIGIGEPKHAKRYGEKLAPASLSLVTAGTEAHRAYGVGRGSVAQLSGPRTMAAALRATASGHFQGLATGDMQMLSATFIVDTDGTIRYAHYSEFAGDMPGLEEVLGAAQKVTRAPVSLRL